MVVLGLVDVLGVWLTVIVLLWVWVGLWMVVLGGLLWLGFRFTYFLLFYYIVWLLVGCVFVWVGFRVGWCLVLNGGLWWVVGLGLGLGFAFAMCG